MERPPMNDKPQKEFEQMMDHLIDGHNDVEALRGIAKNQMMRITELQVQLADKNRLLNVDLTIEELNDSISKLLDVQHQKFMATVGKAMIDGFGIGDLEAFNDALKDYLTMSNLFAHIVSRRRLVIELINDDRENRDDRDDLP